MKLRFEQLKTHLARDLAAIYVVYGDEPLLVQEAADEIRKAARRQGYCERECWMVEPGFGWDQVLESSNSFSLFAKQRLLELRLGDTKPGEAGSKTLQAYAARPPEDTILLVVCGKLDMAAQNSRWFKGLDTGGMTVPVWPVGVRELPAWIKQRMGGLGLQPTAEAVALLAERVEGNLLAASQEIDKLLVLFGQGPITEEQVLAAVADTARYSVYDLVDAALSEQTGRAVRILNGLRAEGLSAVLVIWALHREIRVLAKLAYALEQGESIGAALTRHGVWQKRKSLLQQALRRLSSAACRQLLGRCHHIDCVIKGIEKGNPWDELLLLTLELAGHSLYGRQTIGPEVGIGTK
jgi:DNA polymerase-3 subunit delta